MTLMQWLAGIAAAVLLPLAGFLLGQYRRSGVLDAELKQLHDAVRECKDMNARVQRLELVVGVDPAAGGGLSAQIETLSGEIESFHKVRIYESRRVVEQLAELTKTIAEMKHALETRVLRLELIGPPGK